MNLASLDRPTTGCSEAGHRRRCPGICKRALCDTGEEVRVRSVGWLEFTEESGLAPSCVAESSRLSIFWGPFRLPGSAASSAIRYIAASWKVYTQNKGRPGIPFPAGLPFCKFCSDPTAEPPSPPALSHPNCALTGLSATNPLVSPVQPSMFSGRARPR